MMLYYQDKKGLYPLNNMDFRVQGGYSAMIETQYYREGNLKLWDKVT
jgi:hypothetical protein